MLRFIFATAYVLLLSTFSYGQYAVTGIVKDSKTNQTLVNASVQFQSTNQSAVTDVFGRFKIEKVKPGEYDLVVKYLGYADYFQKVNVIENLQLTISMEQSSIITDEVVVNATRATDKTPTTFTDVSREKIQQQNFGQDLPILLNWTPSVVTTSDAGNGVGYTGIRIRGSDATRINVTVNGIPYNDSESLSTYWVDIPDIASSSQSIQIQRGVGTSTNGAGAFGGSINLQTTTRNDQPYAEAVNTYGSFNTHKHTLNLGTGLLNNHWIIDGRISKINSDGFIDRASSDLQSYYFSSAYYAKSTMVKAVVFGGKERTYQSWYGVPESKLKNDAEAMLITAGNEGWNDVQVENLIKSNSRTFNPYLYSNQVDDYKQTHYQLHFSHQFNSAISFNTALHFTPGKGYYEEYKYDAKFKNYGLDSVQVGNQKVGSSDLVRRRWLDNNFYGLTYSANYDKDNLNLVFGGAWNRYVGDHYGEITWAQISAVAPDHQYYFNIGDKRDFNTFLKANYQITEKLNAFADVQFRRVTYKASGIENDQNDFDINADFNFINPKAGLTYTLNERNQLYASYAIGNREPVREDFINYPGNKPKAEHLQNIEIGFRQASTMHTFHANYYLMNYTNQLVLTGDVNDVGAFVRTNAGKSYRMGVELEGIVKLSERFTWNANLTLSQNKIKEFSEILVDYGVNFDESISVERKFKKVDISFSPNLIGGSSLSFIPFQNADITLLTKYVGKQYLDNTGNDARSIKAYMTNDLRVSYNIKPSFVKSIGLSFLVNNMFDLKYESNGYTYGYLGGGSEYRENFYYPQAGRNYMAMVSIKF